MRLYSTITGPHLWKIPEMPYFVKINVNRESLEDIILCNINGAVKTPTEATYSTIEFASTLIYGEIASVESLFVDPQVVFTMEPEFIALRKRRRDLLSKAWSENMLSAVKEALDARSRISLNDEGFISDFELFKMKSTYTIIAVTLCSSFYSMIDNKDIGTQTYFQLDKFADIPFTEGFIERAIEDMEKYAGMLNMDTIDLMATLRAEYIKKLVS